MRLTRVFPLGAAAVAPGLGVPVAEVAERLATLPQVPGRLEKLTEEPCPVFADYAHTPDALERALAAGRPALLNIRVQSQISMRAQGIVDSRKKGGAF